MALQETLPSQMNYTQYSTNSTSFFNGYTKKYLLKIPSAYTDGSWELQTTIKAGNIDSFNESSSNLVNFNTTITLTSQPMTLEAGHTISVPVGNAVMDLVITKDGGGILYGRYSVKCMKPTFASGVSPITPEV